MVIKLIEVLIFASLLMLSFLLITNPQGINKKANRWFGVFILQWSSYWLEEYLMNIAGIQIDVDGFLILNLVQFLTPVTFFICILYFTEPAYRFRAKDFKYLIVPFLYLLVVIANRYTDRDLYSAQLLLVLVHALFYSGYSLIKIRRHKQNIQKYSSSIREINLNWLEYIIIATIGITACISVFNIVFYELPLNLFMNITMLIVIFFIAYNALKQSEIFPQEVQEANSEIQMISDGADDEPKRQLLTDDQVKATMERLEELMADKELYLNSDLNLIKLSDLLEVTPHHLSFVINKGFNVNFFMYVNKFRVEKAKQMLADNNNNNLSILGIAFESGFSSKTSFNTTFKKITGQTPSEFKKGSSNL